MIAYVTSFTAGGLAALSPCVLPVLPIMVGSSAQRSKLGPLALATGMVMSFAFIGILFSASTSIFGVSESQLRVFSTVLLLVFGVALISAGFKTELGKFSQPLANFADRLSRRLESKGTFGQFGIGALLGAAWSPCIGPALGISLGLASSEGSQWQGALLVTIFGLGMSVPFLAVAYGFRKIFLSHRSKLAAANRYAAPILGLALVGISVAMLTGADKAVETKVIALIPVSFFEFINQF